MAPYFVGTYCQKKEPDTWNSSSRELYRDFCPVIWANTAKDGALRNQKIIPQNLPGASVLLYPGASNQWWHPQNCIIFCKSRGSSGLAYWALLLVTRCNNMERSHLFVWGKTCAQKGVADRHVCSMSCHLYSYMLNMRFYPCHVAIFGSEPKPFFKASASVSANNGTPRNDLFYLGLSI